MSSEEDSTGLKSPMPGPEMPYSVSMPMTLGMAITLLGYVPLGASRRPALQVLPGADPLDLPALAVFVPEQGPDVHDPLALLPGDPGPVVGVRGVRQVLVLLELVPDCGQEVLELEALLPLGEEPLD